MDESRFRRALKNPIVMVILCSLAGFAVYHNAIESDSGTPLPVSVVSTPVSAASGLTTLAPSLIAHDAVSTQWIDHPERDPFAPMSVSSLPKPTAERSRVSTSLTPRSRPRSSHTLMLKAVAIEANNRSAVINRQVVYEGEMVGGYQVVSIQLKGVWLTRHGKKRFLTFTTNPNS